MFGDSIEFVNYIECSLPERGGQTQICKDAGIKMYPTWEFKDDKRVEGVMSFEMLSEKTNCRFGGE